MVRMVRQRTVSGARALSRLAMYNDDNALSAARTVSAECTTMAHTSFRSKYVKTPL